MAHYRQNIPFVCPGVERTSRAQKENILLYMNMHGCRSKKNIPKKIKTATKISAEMQSSLEGFKITLMFGFTRGKIGHT